MKIDLLRKYRLGLYFSRIEKRQGVCSRRFLGNTHILLWDFDEVELPKVTTSLIEIQLAFDLPNIYILESSNNRHHAYCFVARTFKEIIHILSGTKDIDLEYLRLGMVRGYYTLRFSPRRKEHFKLLMILESDALEEMSPLDVTINNYYTTNKGGNNA